MKSCGLAVNELSKPAKKAKLLRLYSHSDQGRTKAELIEPLHRMRKDVEPDAEFFDLASRFVDFRTNSVLMEEQRRC